MKCGFSDIFSRHICSTVAETIGVTHYAASLVRKNVHKTTFEAAETGENYHESESLTSASMVCPIKF